MSKFFGILIIVVLIVVLAIVTWSMSSGNEIILPETSVSSSTDSVGQTTSVPSKLSETVTNSASNTMNNNIVTIETNKGTIVIEMYNSDAPKTVANFVNLTSKGFYNGLTFHRVIEGFMIQGGDPSGNGTGGPGYKFADELNPSTPSYQKGYVRGTVAMANSGPNTNGSQFFIVQKDTPLPMNYTIFGHVISGMEVVDAIAAIKTDAADKPVTDMVMKKVIVTK